MKQRFLHPLTFFVQRVVFKQFAILVGHYQFIVFHHHAVFFQALAFTVGQYAEFAFNGYYLVERRYQKVTRPYRGVTYLQTV